MIRRVFVAFVLLVPAASMAADDPPWRAPCTCSPLIP